MEEAKGCRRLVSLILMFCPLFPGLPKPNKRHALAMVRFAQDCLNHIGKVTKSLEESLGADTSTLAMRVGLHSGPGKQFQAKKDKFLVECAINRLITLAVCYKHSNGRSSSWRTEPLSIIWRRGECW